MWKVECGLVTDKDINVFSGYHDDELGITRDNIINQEKIMAEKFSSYENKTFAYLAKIKDIELLNSMNNQYQENKVMGQRQAWHILLQYAIMDKWGVKVDVNNIKISPNGKPYMDKYEFSISHCQGLVCVVISEVEVGVDIECATKPRQWQRLSRRVLTLEEQDISKDEKTMTAIWTKKEAVFKLLGERVFNPSKIDISRYCVDTIDDIFYDDNFYILSVATHKKTANHLIVKTMQLLKEGWSLV